METQPLRPVAYEVFKFLNDLNPNFLKEIFWLSLNLTHRKGNFYVHYPSTEKFWNKSLILLWLTYGTHCLKTLSKHQVFKIAI